MNLRSIALALSLGSLSCGGETESNDTDTEGNESTSSTGDNESAGTDEGGKTSVCTEFSYEDCPEETEGGIRCWPFIASPYDEEDKCILPPIGLGCLERAGGCGDLAATDGLSPDGEFFLVSRDCIPEGWKQNVEPPYDELTFCE